MKDTELDLLDHIPRDVVVMERQFAAHSRYPAHRHERGQLAYARQGCISVMTRFGHWLVPPGRAVWVPAGIEHEMQMLGPVTMLNTFVSEDAAERVGLAEHCQVCAISPLLHQLLLQAVDLPRVYPTEGRSHHLMNLLLAEISMATVLPLHAPLPMNKDLIYLCKALLAAPTLQMDTDDMAKHMAMSRSTFTRFFRKETGISYMQWRQQACLLAAITRLEGGQSVTTVALDLGYSSPSAFTALFRKTLGMSPQSYIRMHAG
jgi:AraC-like DNA-binding protein